MPVPLLVVLAFAKQGRPRGNPAMRDRIQPATGTFGTGRSTDEPRSVQPERAQQPGRGRFVMPRLRGGFLGGGGKRYFLADQPADQRQPSSAVAAGVVFYGLLALFPGITALVSLYGLFASPSTINDHLSSIGGMLPGDECSRSFRIR